MAFNSHHSAPWSDGDAGNNSINASGNTDSISWADIEKSLDTSSLAGTNYGRGSLARSSDLASTTTAVVSEATPTGDNFAFAGGFGLVQAGVSPFRGLDPNGEFFSNPTKRYQDVRSNFQATETLALAEPTIGSQPKLNGALLRMIGNLQKRDSGLPVGELSLPNKLEASTPEAKFSIGLAIANDAEVHQPGKVARAVVRLPETAPAAETVEQPIAKVEAAPLPKAPEAEVNPIDNPFQYVGDQHTAIKDKFHTDNVKYGQTKLLPDGRVVEVQTASDNTTLTNTKCELGANSMVVHDRYRRPVTEQHTDSDGSWSFSNLSYNDSKGIKPFCSEKLTVNSDGSVVKMRYSSMGQIESKHTFA